MNPETLYTEGLTHSSPALRYRIYEPRHGRPPRHTVVLSHALGCDLSMWDKLTERLSADCRVIAYDQRGHGKSEVPPGPYSMGELAEDAVRLLKELETGPVVWIGISMGGMVAQELVLRHPAMVVGLVIANSTSHYPEAAQTTWQQRIITLEQQGIPGIVEATLERFFSPQFHDSDPATVNVFRRRLLSTDLQGYLACCHAVRAINTTDRLPQVTTPTLLIASEQDQGTPVDMAKVMAERMPYARLTVLPQAAHLSAVEQPDAFAEAVERFTKEL